jgi:hypothetical protein
MRKVRCVIGRVEGPLDLDEDEKVIFAGSCTSWEGKIDGQDVKIESSYKNYREVDENNTQSNDMLLKFFKTFVHILMNRSSRYIHAKGCTLSVAEFVNLLSGMAQINNPNLDPRLMVPVNIAYWKMRFHRFLNRLVG